MAGHLLVLELGVAQPRLVARPRPPARARAAVRGFVCRPPLQRWGRIRFIVITKANIDAKLTVSWAPASHLNLLRLCLLRGGCGLLRAERGAPGEELAAAAEVKVLRT